MEKYFACVMVLYGVASMLYQWVQMQKLRQKRIEEFLLFLQKSLYVMEKEPMRLIVYFMEYPARECVLRETLQEIGERLEKNQYPRGEQVWEEVFLEKKKAWDCEEETFVLLFQAGMGFFGRDRKENICFLQKSIQELEVQQKKRKEKDTQERKVWLPLGMLGCMMFLILLM